MFDLPSGIVKVTEPLTRGARVKALQEALSAVFFYPEKEAKNNGIDGYFGQKQKMRSQLMHGLALKVSMVRRQKQLFKKHRNK
ncbi:hypothetical protein MKZ03_05710 [Bacillus sp. FSL R5-0431]|uniref:hypothetical protein n=1 Tax=Bacillus TaxID=1386 RepID=UPI0030F63440